MSTWLLYGAYGYTGRLILEEAVRRGHRPVIAGRTPSKLTPLARRYELPWVSLALDNESLLHETVAGVDAVLHAAGPFTRTAAPMRKACLAGGTHYLDITGEIPVFAATLVQDGAARTANVALVSGVGFDIVPSDCLAKYVADPLPDVAQLEVGLTGFDAVSRGTLITALDQVLDGGVIRRNDKLIPLQLGRGGREIPFRDGPERAIPIPLGDVVTAARTTGASDVTVYAALPGVSFLAATAPLARLVLRIGPLRRAAEKVIGAVIEGPGEETRRRGRTHFWARATATDGAAAEAWLTLREAYDFTARAAVRAVERVVAENPVGALTPALAFGADFVLEIDGTERFDALPQ
jgi:short subunit dehydrogenase-like uncharacterized protein